MKYLIVAFLLEILIGISFAGEADVFDKRFKFIGKEEGVQILYIDVESITRQKNVSYVNTINRIIRGGKLYNAYKSKYPAKDPSFTISSMSFDCLKMRVKVEKVHIYDDNQNIIDKISLDDRWNQVQIKNDIDKNMFNAICK